MSDDTDLYEACRGFVAQQFARQHYGSLNAATRELFAFVQRLRPGQNDAPKLTESKLPGDEHPYCCVACGEVFLSTWGTCSACAKRGRPDALTSSDAYGLPNDLRAAKEEISEWRSAIEALGLIGGPGALRKRAVEMHAHHEAHHAALEQANQMVMGHSMPYGWTDFQKKWDPQDVETFLRLRRERDRTSASSTPSGDEDGPGEGPGTNGGERSLTQPDKALPDNAATPRSSDNASQDCAGKVWTCKIGETGRLPRGADAPMRAAVREAYRKLTGEDDAFIFSGWGGQLTESERAVVEDRSPVADRPSADPHIVDLDAAREDGRQWARDEMAKKKP